MKINKWVRYALAGVIYMVALQLLIWFWGVDITKIDLINFISGLGCYALLESFADSVRKIIIKYEFQ